MKHNFENKIAEVAGVPAAIIYDHICFWCDFNKKKKVNLIKGKYWMYQPLEKMCAYFSFYTYNQVYNGVKKLIECNLIETGYFNTKKSNRTRWYTPTNYSLNLIEFSNNNHVKNNVKTCNKSSSSYKDIKKENYIKKESFSCENSTWVTGSGDDEENGENGNIIDNFESETEQSKNSDAQETDFDFKSYADKIKGWK